MMQSSIDENAQKKRRKDAVQSAVISSIILCTSAMVLLGVQWYCGISGILGILLIIYGLIELGMIIPVWILLKERLKEIEGGEEDVAAQY